MGFIFDTLSPIAKGRHVINVRPNTMNYLHRRFDVLKLNVVEKRISKFQVKVFELDGRVRAFKNASGVRISRQGDGLDELEVGVAPEGQAVYRNLLVRRVMIGDAVLDFFRIRFSDGWFAVGQEYDDL